MGNPYTSVTVSGYNASPPPDDGSNVAANEIKYSVPKTKLGDPLKTAIEAVDTNITTAFAKLFFANVTAVGTNYTVQSTDQGKLIRATAAVTITTPSAGTEGVPFTFLVKNDHTAAITIEGNGAETIDGAVNISLPAGVTVILGTNGSNWFTGNPYGALANANGNAASVAYAATFYA